MKRNFSKRKQGFMLIELSIALVVIGLLFAGISGGTALIENAKVRATLSQIETIKNAAIMFDAEYGLPPGGLKNTLNYFPNAIFKKNSAGTSYEFTCMREGNNKKIAAEGSGKSIIKGKTMPINVNAADGIGIDIATDKLTYAGIALCQLHSGKYLDLPTGSKPSTVTVNPGEHAPQLKMAGQASIMLISDSYRGDEYSMVIGDASGSKLKGAAKFWNGETTGIEGILPGNLLKKLDLKLSTGKMNTGDFIAYEKIPGSSRSSIPNCNYQEKKPNCLAIYKLGI